MPGTGEQVRVNMSSIIAESDADFDQKMAYSRYYLLSHLQKYLPSEEYESIVNDATIKPSKEKPSMPKLSNQLKQQLAKQKRFNLN
jgi:hypothetical protein